MSINMLAGLATTSAAYVDRLRKAGRNASEKYLLYAHESCAV